MASKRHLRRQKEKQREESRMLQGKPLLTRRMVQCGDKDQYEDELSALRGLERVRAKYGVHDLMSPYPCRFCDKWHIGHPPAEIRSKVKSRMRFIEKEKAAILAGEIELG